MTGNVAKGEMAKDPLYQRLRRYAANSLLPEIYWPREVVIDGAPVRVRHMPYSYRVKDLLVSGSYESAERELIARVVRPGMHVLDLGGSIGVIAAVLAARVGPHGRVVSVEASAELARHCRENLGRSPNVRVQEGYAFPVWRLPDDLRVRGFIADGQSLTGRVVLDADADATPPPPQATQQSSVRSLDLSTLCSENDLQPQVLVMDIEGSERVLLDNAGHFPACLQSMIIEFHPALFAGGEEDLRKIVANIETEGFKAVARVGDNILLHRGQPSL